MAQQQDSNSADAVNGCPQEIGGKREGADGTVLQDSPLQNQQQYLQVQVDIHDTMYLIKQLCRAYAISYSHQFGSVCAHISLHYPSSSLKQPPRDWIVANHIVNRYNLIFLQKKYIHKVELNSCFRDFQEIVLYGMKSISYALEANFLKPLNNSKHHYERLKAITVKLLRSLFLEFIPVEYSGVILGIYLGDKRQSSEKEEWIKTNKQNFPQLAPYQDVFQLMHSLSFHLVSNKRPVNIEHFLTLLQNPVMGVVEWPMVIGTRDHFDLPPLQQQQ